MWWEGNPCNMHLNDLAAEVKVGVEEAGLVGLRFNTIGVSDGISMGTDGMSFSLQSRDIIAGEWTRVGKRERGDCARGGVVGVPWRVGPGSGRAVPRRVKPGVRAADPHHVRLRT